MGLKALTAARRQHGATLISLIGLLPRGLPSLPTPMLLSDAMSPDLRNELGEQRVRLWFGLRDSLWTLRGTSSAFDHRYVTAGLADCEDAGRRALASAVEAYIWFDDASRDLHPRTLVQVGVSSTGAIQGCFIERLVQDAHLLLHQAGELVGGLFGCLITAKDGTWFDRCEVALAHLRFGNSAGITMSYSCSICALPVGTCAHILGDIYDVQVEKSGSECSACGEACIEHVDGQVVRLVAEPRPVNPVLHEISLTPRPRDPLCRITARSIGTDQLVRHLGRHPQVDEVVWDHGCMHPCGGFSTMPVS